MADASEGLPRRAAPTLRRAFVLIDARHGVKAVDDEIMTLLDRAAVTFQVRADQGRQGQGRPSATRFWRRCARALAKHPAAFPEIVVTSSEKGDGIDDAARRHRHAGLARAEPDA